MKRFYTKFLTVILIASIIGISSNTALAFGSKNKKNSQTAAVSKAAKKDYNIDDRAKSQEQVTITIKKSLRITEEVFIIQAVMCLLFPLIC